MKAGYARISTEKQSLAVQRDARIAHARAIIDGDLQNPSGMAGLLGVDHSTLWQSMRRLEANANGL